MSFLTDLRSVSEKALEQIADRFGDLPRPLLAAIGAGDMTAERLAELRETLQSQVPGTELPDIRGVAADLPARAQKAAEDLAGSLQRLATQAPDRARELVEELPGKVSEFSSALSPDTLRDTAEAYTRLAGMIYGHLADRGDKAWSRVRSGALAPGTVVSPAPESPAARTAPAPAAPVAPPAPPDPVAPPAPAADTPPTPAPKRARAAAPKRPATAPKSQDSASHVVPPHATTAPTAPRTGTVRATTAQDAAGQTTAATAAAESQGAAEPPATPRRRSSASGGAEQS